MSSALAAIIERAIKGIKPLVSNLSLEAERMGQDLLGRREQMKLPEDLRIFRWDVERPGGEIPAEWFNPEDAPDDRVLIYFHGGSYIAGTLMYCRLLASEFAESARLNTISFEYRLAPEHPYPAALLDAECVYENVLSIGVAPEKVAFLGESAGGGLICSLLLKLRDRGVPLPGAAAVISPWTDLTLSGETYRTNEKVDPMLSAAKLDKARHFYTDEANFKDPYVSPAYGNFKGCPPVLIHVGSHEILLSDSRKLAEAMKESGSDVTLDEWAGMWHVWHAFDTRESKLAREGIVRFILRCFER
jgi:acetyl esterase/lipase